MAKNNQCVKISVNTKVVGLEFENNFYVDKKGIEYSSQEKNYKEMIEIPLLSDDGFSKCILFNITLKKTETLKASSISLVKELKEFLNPEAQSVLKTELVKENNDNEKKYVILKTWIENDEKQKIANSDKEFWIFKIGDNDFILCDKPNLKDGNEIHNLTISINCKKIDVVNVDKNNKEPYSFSKEILENELLKYLEEQKTEKTKTLTTQVYELKNLKSKFEVKSVKVGKGKVREKTDVDEVIFEIKGNDKKTFKVFSPGEEDALYNEHGKKVKLDETSGNVLEIKESEENRLSNSELLLEAILRNNNVNCE